MFQRPNRLCFGGMPFLYDGFLLSFMGDLAKVNVRPLGVENVLCGV